MSTCLTVRPRRVAILGIGLLKRTGAGRLWIGGRCCGRVLMRCHGRDRMARLIELARLIVCASARVARLNVVGLVVVRLGRCWERRAWLSGMAGGCQMIRTGTSKGGGVNILIVTRGGLVSWHGRNR